MPNINNSISKIRSYAYWIEKISVFLIPFLSISLVLRWIQDKIPFLKDAQVWVPHIDRNNVTSMTPDSLHYLENLSCQERLIGFSIEAITLVIVLAGLMYCIKLMRYFYQGQIFSAATITLFRKISKLALLWALYTPVSTLLLSIYVFHETPEARALSLGYATDNALLKLVFFSFFLIISFMLQEGFRLKTEQDLTV